MKLIYVLLALVFVFPKNSPAQYSANNIKVASLLKSGAFPSARLPQWEREQDQVNGHISSSKLAKMKNVSEAIITFFHDSCLSEGPYVPVWHGEYFSEKNSPGPGMKFGVQCNFNDQNALLTVTANDMSPLLDHLAVNNQDFLTIKPAVAEKNDCPYFEDGHSKTWLVVADEHQLPYTPVSRKEYLQEARKEVSNIKDLLITYIKQKAPVRPADAQAAEKKSTIDQLTAVYSGIELRVRMKQFLNNYETDEEYLKENIEKGTAGLDSTLHLMDSLLNHWPVNELNKPAFVSVVAASFQGFEDGRSDKMLVRMNPAFLNPAPGVEKPRSFLVTWQYDPSDPMAIAIGRQIEERFNGQKLKELLGK
jgi:hypothetical protein